MNVLAGEGNISRLASRQSRSCKYTGILRPSSLNINITKEVAGCLLLEWLRHCAVVVAFLVVEEEARIGVPSGSRILDTLPSKNCSSSGQHLPILLLEP